MSDNQEKKIKNLIKGAGHTMEEAAELLGMARQTLYNAIRKTPLDQDFVKKVNNKLEIDLEAVKDKVSSGLGHSKAQSLNREDEEQTIRYVPETVKAGFLSSFSNPTFKNGLQEIKLPPEYYGIQWVFEVDGDSMYPTFSNGDHIGCRMLMTTKYIRFGEPYILDIGDGGLLLKRIIKNKDNPDMVILRSDNNGYDDIDVLKEDIKHIFLITTKISKNVGYKRSYEDQILKMGKDLEILTKKLK
ncbi:MAG: hypothetical protein M3Q58_02780 [Bacteroidota bacterium]|nr:hypothetical protein [Bacteroidota bacterium]